MNRLGGVAALLSAVAAFIGFWFFATERQFAADHPTQDALASNLQWVGAAISLLGVAGFLIGLAIGYQDRR